jgi:membrane protease YdiL (CAAX protease family)
MEADIQHDLDRRRVWYSAGVFFVLATGLGAGVVALVVRGSLPPELALAAALSASVAGVVMTAVEDGRAGLKLMVRRLLIWRVGMGYWLFALLFLIPTVLIGSLANPLFNGDRLSLGNFEPAFPIVPMFVVFFIAAGLGQELGWSGYLTARLQAHYGALTASVIRAVLTALWNLPLFLSLRADHASLASFPYGGWIADMGFLAAFGAFTLLFVLPWSIFFGWMFNNTRGSLLLVSVLHGSEIWAGYWMLSTGIDPRDVDNYWGYGAVLAATAAVLVLTGGPENLSRKLARTVYRSTRRQ